MAPLEMLAHLLQKYGHAQLEARVSSLAAREELRVEGFWEDLGASEIWGREDSLASLDLRGEADVSDQEYTRDEASFRRALFLLADDMALRGVGTVESDWWAGQLSPR